MFTAFNTPALVSGLVGKPLPAHIENFYINSLSFSILLRDHPDREAVNFILSGLQTGFDLGYRGQLTDQFRDNNKSARDNHRLVTQAVHKEVSRGHTAGPFAYPPFNRNNVSPLGAAPKSDGSCRLVLDLSQPRGNSVNDHIHKEEFPTSYTHFDAATELTLLKGRGCLLSKIDIKHAYRLLPVRPDNWPLLVYRWDGYYYVDLKLPFGGRSSASIFTSFADLVCWILNHKYGLVAIHYSDDFLLFTRAYQSLALRHLQTFKDAFSHLNIPIQEDKLVGPSTKITYLGIQIDTVTFTVSIPEDKVKEALEMMPKWCNRRTSTKRELQSLMGKLNFFSKVVLPGRLFVRRLIDLSTTVKMPSHHVTINREARDDIHWWCEFLQSWNQSSFIPDPRRIYSTDLLLFTDAAKLIGLGGVFGSAWIQSEWNEATRDKDIDFKELFAILAAVVTWGHQWAGKRVIIVTDNKPITQIWSSGSTPSPHLMCLTRKIFLFAAANNFSLSLKHILGHFNPVADALSRFQMPKFRRLMPDAETNPTPIPATVWELGNHLERTNPSTN